MYGTFLTIRIDQITVILFTVLHPLALLSALIYDQFSNRQGRIALPSDDADQDPIQSEGRGRGPREVDAEAVWGSA